jgi:hypothetical protein
MYNLIQIQDAIKGLPMQEVMKYARGSNPDVPAYLALAELNRRKQLQETATAFYGEPQTVREQIEGSLTGAPRGQVDPTAAPAMTNPATPPQLQTLTAPPPKPQMPAMQAPVNLTQAPPVPQMRKGGLASLPVGMFKRANYAGGGIVAFDNGGSAEEERRKQLEEDRRRQLESDRAALGGGAKSLGSAAKDILTLPQRAAAGIINTGIRGARAVTGADIPYLYQDNPEMLESMTPYYDRDVRRAEIERADAQKRQVQMEAQDRQEGSESRAATPNRQASATTSGQISNRAPAEPMFGKKVTVTQPPLPELTDEQLFERRRKLQELAGVSQDPYAGVRERYSKIEARRAAEEAEDPKNALRAMLRGYAQAKATDPFGVQLAAGADKMAAFDKEMSALRDKQASSMAELQLNMSKEEDARKRGDVSAVESARAAQEKAKMDLAKLEIERMNAQTARISATRPAAEIQTIERVMKDKNMTFTEAMEYLQGVRGLNALRTAADKEWNESLALRMEWEKKGGYPAYMASKGLSVGSQQPQITPPAVGTVKDGYRFKGGNPADKNSWEKV